jgi:hypothetical protein
MGKKQSKEVLAQIDGYINKQAIIDSREMRVFVETIAEPPDYDTLKIGFFQRLAASRIGMKRDADGLRYIFSNGDKTSPKYVNLHIATKEHLPDVYGAIQSQEHKLKRMMKNVSKLKTKATALEGQISLEEYISDTKTEDIHNAVK